MWEHVAVPSSFHFNSKNEDYKNKNWGYYGLGDIGKHKYKEV